MGLVAALGQEEIALGLGFDALGQDGEAHLGAQGDDGAGDGGVVIVPRQPAHEALIDLQLVRGQALETGQGGIAGAEVIDADHDPPLAQPIEHRADLAMPLHHHRLGDLQLQAGRRQAAVRQGLMDPRQQIAALDLQPGDVDRHPAHGQTRVEPGAALPAGLPQHPGAQFADQAGILGHGDEARGRNQALLGMGPAGQGLDADQGTGAQVDLRLVVEPQLVQLQGLAQLSLQQDALEGGVGHVLGIELVVVASPVLGAVHGGIGVLQQGLDRLAIAGIDADAHAGGDIELMGAQPQRRGEGLDEAVGLEGGLLPGGQVFRQHHELIAAEPGEGVILAHDGLKTRGDGLQQVVAQVMAQAVVDPLEAIQVDEDHRQNLGLPLGGLQGVLKPGAQQQAVRQAGHGVVMGQVLELGLVVFQGADVGEDADALGQITARVPHRAEGQPDGIAVIGPGDVVLPAAIPDLAAPTAGLGHGAPDGAIEGRLLAVAAELVEGLANDLPLRIAGDVGEGAIDRLDMAPGVRDHDPFLGVREHHVPGAQVAQQATAVTLILEQGAEHQGREELQQPQGGARLPQ